ncbi:unnamed protein product [Kuraishia capsulata CBS 1993]|uniref:Uncharacterized protein n=1 Tax=Kuraishia capsulata CBS 1993 TaxID=1382522 RepID=W6MWI7_9ASCO|nr:uncharacterized protein KUCA_T00003478001 [Kuraishia capsulata CBS 1993]CDK27500.1 unnamed protein product [Kuraishia capsulata CBS 1993]
MFPIATSRIISQSARLYSTTAPVARKGGLKGTLFGFLLGVTITGFGSYYYLVDEYKSSSNAVVSDVLSLQKSIRNLESHVRSLEDATKK